MPTRGKTGKMEERLNKWLGEMGVCSRREADRLIESGKVMVDGRAAVMGQKVLPGQRVICDGKIVQGGREQKPEPVLLVVNKPKGIVCTTSDKDKAENIVEFLKYPERVYPVGRLDKESEGLILMTNQGDLVNKIMRSGNAHEKEYVVTIDKPVTETFMAKMEKGVWLEELDETTRPCKVEKMDDKIFSITLTQGLNRQIRRMCQACGCEVRSLKRVRVMNIRLGTLRAGAFRKVTPMEYKELTRLLKDSSSLSVKEQKGSGDRMGADRRPGKAGYSYADKGAGKPGHSQADRKNGRPGRPQTNVESKRSGHTQSGHTQSGHTQPGRTQSGRNARKAAGPRGRQGSQK